MRWAAAKVVLALSSLSQAEVVLRPQRAEQPQVVQVCIMDTIDEGNNGKGVFIFVFCCLISPDV